MKQIRYNNELIDYEIVRKKIKNVYLRIVDAQVIISAPKYISEEEIEKLIYQKAKWIINNLNKKQIKCEKQDLYTQEEFISLVTNITKELGSITGLKPNKIRIRQINYAWGSCSSKKNITINGKLIKYSKQAIRYVILHELCHIKHMNHSKEFWDLVQCYMPDYKEAKKELKN